jgi:prevent-host-death family protein
MVNEIGAFEAKNKLSELLQRVEQGQEFTITRHGRPVARLVPIRPEHDVALARQAATRIMERSAGATLAGLSLRQLIDEGRR